MSEFFRYLMIGLGNGAIYAMLGLGLVVIFRSTGLLNFAQGELAMLTTFLVWTYHDAGLPLFLALLAGMASGFVIGALVHRVAIQPLGDAHANPLGAVVVTVGLLLAVNSLAQLIWGTEDRSFPTPFPGSFEMFGVGVTWQKIGTLGVLAVEALVFWVIFQKTKLGLAMRSVASNAESSALVGIPVNKILMIGWGLAAAVGAVAGSFTAPDRGLGSNLMQLTLIFSFAAITLGGFDSFVGAVVGGLIVGVATEVVPRYVSAVDKMPLAPAFVLIVLVLLFRPQGLFGSKKVSRV
jgi:branched-chain amino acid transport system permease protein